MTSCRRHDWPMRNSDPEAKSDNRYKQSRTAAVFYSMHLGMFVTWLLGWVQYVGRGGSRGL